MFLDENNVTVNKFKHRALTEAYVNEYANSFPLDPAIASKEYRQYMTRSLIERGFLYKNSKMIEDLRKAPLEEIFNDKFKDIFLYNKDRDLTDIYGSIKDVANMGAVGNFDLLSSMITCVSAKMFPIFETENVDENQILDRIHVTLPPKEEEPVEDPDDEQNDEPPIEDKPNETDKPTEDDPDPEAPKLPTFTPIDTSVTPCPQTVEEMANMWKKDGDFTVPVVLEDFHVERIEHPAITTYSFKEDKDYYIKRKGDPVDVDSYTLVEGEYDENTEYYVRDGEDNYRLITDEDLDKTVIEPVKASVQFKDKLEYYTRASVQKYRAIDKSLIECPQYVEAIGALFVYDIETDSYVPATLEDLDITTKKTCKADENIKYYIQTEENTIQEIDKETFVFDENATYFIQEEGVDEEKRPVSDNDWELKDIMYKWPLNKDIYEIYDGYVYTLVDKENDQYDENTDYYIPAMARSGYDMANHELDFIHIEDQEGSTTIKFKDDVSYYTKSTTTMIPDIYEPLEKDDYECPQTEEEICMYVLNDENVHILATLDDFDSETTEEWVELNLSWLEGKEYYTKDPEPEEEIDITPTDPSYEEIDDEEEENTFTPNEGEEDTFVPDEDYDDEEEEEGLTEEEKQLKRLKIEKLIEILNSTFYNELVSTLDFSKFFVSEKDLYTIFDSIRQEDKHYAELLKNFYYKIVNCLAIFFYTVNIAELLDQNTNENVKCYPLEIAKWFVKNNLSKMNKVEDMIGIEKYFTPSVLKKVFSEDFYKNYDRETNFINPVIDLINTAEINFPIEQVSFSFAENLFGFRTIMENTLFRGLQPDNLNYQNVFGLFLFNINIYLQLFFMESYLSRNKFQVHTNVGKIIKAFVPDFGSIIKWEAIHNFVNIDYEEEK